MKLRAHFYLLNENFSPEYAEANHGGKETENNQLYEWEDELEVGDLSKIQINRNAIIPIQGYLPTDEFFSVEATNMLQVELTTSKDEKAYLGISESILDHYEFDENSELSELRVYIKDYEPHGNPVPGIYIASKEFPKELIF